MQPEEKLKARTAELDEKEEKLEQKTSVKQFLIDNYKDLFKILLIVAIVIFVIADYHNLSNLNIRELLTREHTLVGSGLMVLVIYFVKGIVMVIPAAVVYISVGMAFEPWIAVILNTLGMIVELVASYFLGKFLSIDYIDNLMNEQRNGSKIVKKIQDNSRLAMFTLRFVPIFPVDIISLFYGSIKYPFWKYMGWSMLGIMPRVILFTILGKKIYDWFPDLSAKVIIYIILVILVISLAAGLITHFRKKHKKKAKTDYITQSETFRIEDEEKGFRIVKPAMPKLGDEIKK